MINKLTLLILCIFTSLNSFAIDATTKANLVDNIALERVQAYAGSSVNSPAVGILEPGTEVIEHTTFIKTKPGLAVMSEKSLDKRLPFDRGAHIRIWEYLENGFSRIVLNDVTYTTRIARSEKECDSFRPNKVFCWARVIEEPEYFEWKQLSITPDGQKFWILNRIIDGSGTLPIKDKGINVHRVVNTKYVKDEPKKEEIIEEQQPDDASKQELDPSLLEGIELPDDPMAQEMFKNMIKPKAQREKEKQEREQKALESKKQKLIEQRRRQLAGENPTNHQEPKIFKQQNISNIQMNFDESNPTQQTINKVNKQRGQVRKLDLKKNTPLDLTQ